MTVTAVHTHILSREKVEAHYARGDDLTVLERCRRDPQLGRSRRRRRHIGQLLMDDKG